MNSKQQSGGSLLFQPHRTLGVLCTSSPFSFAAGSNSLDSFITVPQQERFVIYRCDTLRPVLVSDALPSSAPLTQDIHGTYAYSSELQNPLVHKRKKVHQEFMYHAVTDTSLSITVATHGNTTLDRATHASLYKRTKVIHSLQIVRKNTKVVKASCRWGITQVISLGRSQVTKIQGDHTKDGRFMGADEINSDDLEESNLHIDHEKKENALILAFLCSRSSQPRVSGMENEVHVVGDSSDESSSEDESTSPTDEDESSSIDSMSRNTFGCMGEVVIVIASRSKMWIEKRIPLHSLPHFYPNFGIHPMTYLNKILVGSRDGSLILLNIRTGKVIHEFKCIDPAITRGKDHSLDEVYPFCITTMAQSPAVDTVAIGTRDGKVHLINLRQDVNLFTLSHNGGTKKDHQLNDSEVTSISFRTDGSAVEYGIAPMAVGLKSGTISVWDLSPKTPMDEVGPRGNSIHATRSLLCQMENVHKGGVSKLLFFPQEPLLISAGTVSNTLIMHVFDNPNHSGRILRHRQGHSSPPLTIRYIHPSTGGILASMADGTDASTCQILSCGGVGDCTVRTFSTARSVLDREFSQGKGLAKKARQLGLDDKADLLLSPVLDSATCQARSRDWGDLVTIHHDHPFAYVWSTKRHAQSGPVLRQDDWEISDMKKQPPRTAHATSVTLSICGNFALVGTRGGLIYKYNVQSGLPRGSYPKVEKGKKDTNQIRIAGDIGRTMKIIEREMKISPKQSVSDKRKKDSLVVQNRKKKMHDGYSVTGLAIDSLNKNLISVGADSKLIVWSFNTHVAQNPISLPSPATKLTQLRESDLLAIALENFSLILFDYSSLTVVRRFGSKLSSARHYGPITDLAFGPDGRKLYTSSLDGTIRVWDVPTSSCIDWMAFKSTPMALTLSPTGEFLATAHAGRLGISLWCDRSFFQMIHSNSSSSINKPYLMDEPATVAETDIFDEESLSNVRLEDNKQDKAVSTRDIFDGEDREQNPPIPKHSGLITLSRLPAAHWKNLFQLELVKERNKPIDPPKKPPTAPFFLQWRSGESLSEIQDEGKNLDKNNSNDAEDEWPAAWFEDDDGFPVAKANDEKIFNGHVDDDKKRKHAGNVGLSDSTKKMKTAYHRSHLAALLQECVNKSVIDGRPKFEPVMEHLSTIGPSAIDVSLSSLCNGMHDLHDGLYFLHLAALWLLESVSLRTSYECVNAYLHRFLHIHATVIAGIDDAVISETRLNSLAFHDTEINDQRVKLLQTLKELRLVQKSGSEELRSKLQRSVCLLRHFSRMV